MKPFFLSVFVFLFAFVSAFSQTNLPICAFDPLHQTAMLNPACHDRHLQQEQQLYQYHHQPHPDAPYQVVTLPVVVHIVHQNGAENIANAQVLAGIDQLNAAFANSAYYDQGSGTNTMIQFCLARRTPDNLPTNGITRNVSPLTNMTLETEDIALKDLNRWEPVQYINIWLVASITSLSSGPGVAGYAYFPSSHGGPEDGIVMEAEYLGSSPANTGVLAHEMGHYLGLYHTFQGGCLNNDCLTDGDRVCDTPPDQSTLWLPCAQVANTCDTDTDSGFSSDQPDMTQNFMDYTDFNCFHDFTPGQSARMQWHIDHVRQSLTTSPGCSDPCPNSVIALFSPYGATVEVGATINMLNQSFNASGYEWKINGTVFSTATNPTYTFPTEGAFPITLVAYSANTALCGPDSVTWVFNVVCPVVADFQVSNLSPVPGELVSLTNLSQNAVGYEWLVNGVSQGPSLTNYTFNSMGVYVFRLIADNGFCTDQQVVYVSVIDSCAHQSFQSTLRTDAAEQARDAIELSDGNYLLSGYGYTGQNNDFILSKISRVGDVIWIRRFGEDFTNDKAASSIALPDGGFIVAGESNGQPIVVRFDAAGNAVWQRRTNNNGYYYKLIATSDGGVLAVGALIPTSFNYSAYLLKLDAAGNTVWAQNYDELNNNAASDARELPNGDWIVSGWGRGTTFGDHDGVIMRLDAAGNMLWHKHVGTTGNEGLFGVERSDDGGFIFVGGSNAFNPETDFNYDDGWLVKTDNAGNIEWTKSYRPSIAIDVDFRSVERTPDGGYAVSMNDYNELNNFDFGYMKIAPDGEIEWSRMYDLGDEDRIFQVRALSDGFLCTGRVFPTGSADDDMLFVRTNEAGFAGLCPELPHTVTVSNQQIQTGSLNYNNAPLPGILADFMPVSDYDMEWVARCEPDCITEQDCESTWIKAFGDPGMSEGLNNLIYSNITHDFYATGYRGDSTVIMRMNREGQVIWARAFKFTSHDDERVNDIIEDSDGNLVGGGRFVWGSFFYGYTFKYDPNADQVVWAYENTTSNPSVYFSMSELQPGGDYFTFNSFHDSPPPGSFDDAHWVRIDRNTGAWVGTPFGFSHGNSEGVIRARTRNGLLYTGGRYSWGNTYESFRGALSAFDANGTELWSRMCMVPQSGLARMYCPDFTFDGDHQVALYYGDFSGGDLFTDQLGVSKTNLDGNTMVWSKRLTITDNPLLQGKSIITIDNGYVLLASDEVALNLYVVKLTINGDLEWAKRIPNATVSRWGNNLLASSGNYLYLAAEENQDFVCYKIDLATGTIGGQCDPMLDVEVQVENLTPVFDPVSLTRYTSPMEQTPRNAPQNAINVLPAENICLTSCVPEICGNGIDDDGDNLFDCLDPDCECTDCDGAQSRIWYFGNSAGLDFENNTPVILNDGQTFSREASAVATDMLGQLLFYTDGQTIFNRNHSPMNNGSNLAGHPSSSQCLILNQPGLKHRFYVFTPNSFDNLGTGEGLAYSLVDMSLDGGMGDVLATAKNLELVPQSQFTEKITATRHCNGVDWWVIVKTRNDNRFIAWLLTENGLGAPVESFGGTPGSAATPNVIGVMKFNPGGAILVNTLFHSGGIDLFNFDNNTGVLTFSATIAPPQMSGAYGLEFSPDGRRLYATNLGAPAHIWQFDVQSANNAAAVQASATILAQQPFEYRFGQLQRASNGKIYVTNTFPLQFTPTLGIIHLPNELGTNCLYQEAGLTLGAGQGANLGLPNFPQQLFEQRIYPLLSGPDTLCGLSQSATFYLDGIDCSVQSVDWQVSSTAGIISSNQTSATVQFFQAGEAQVIAHVTSLCHEAYDTLTVTVLPNTPAILDLGPDRLICENGVFLLSAGGGFARYEWNDGSTEPTYTAIAPGTFWVTAWDFCGNAQTDSVKINVAQPTALDLGGDLLVCSGSSVSFSRPSSFVQWNWSPADGLDCSDCPIVQVSSATNQTYIVVAQTAEGCLSADTIHIEYTTDTIFAALDTSVCEGKTLLFLGVELPPDTVAVFAWQTVGGCDSVLTVTVEGITPPQTTDNQVWICAGDSIQIGGAFFAADTVLTLVHPLATGCDSTVIWRVSQYPPIESLLELSVCAGDTLIYDNTPVPAGSEAVFVYTSAHGCDSTLTVKVLAIPGPDVQISPEYNVSPGETVQLNPDIVGTGPYQYAWSPVEGLSCADCAMPIASPETTTIYTLTVTDAGDCTAAAATTLTVQECHDMYIPNAFTPNKDGTNDWFYPFGPCLKKIKFLRIYDRWGELIFERENFEPNVETLGWNGEYREKPFPVDVLIYVTEVEFRDGVTLRKLGDVSLIR